MYNKGLQGGNEGESLASQGRRELEKAMSGLMLSMFVTTYGWSLGRQIGQTWLSLS